MAAAGLSVLSMGTVLVVGGAAAARPAHVAAAATGLGQVTVIQAVPGVDVGVRLDGRIVKSGAAAGSVLGPFRLAAGSHRVVFIGVEGQDITTTVKVSAGSNRDVVLHLPGVADGAPVVHSYTVPTTAIGPTKSRLLVAHTAAIGPADVDVDGTVVFDNIANGEFAESDVPGGAHKVALFPAGQTTNPILGPISIDLVPRTATMVYAYGTPGGGSMKIVWHTARLAADGTVVPQRVHTGSAGLVGDVAVAAFGTPAVATAGVGSWLAGMLGLLLLVVVAGVWAVRRRVGVPVGSHARAVVVERPIGGHRRPRAAGSHSRRH